MAKRKQWGFRVRGWAYQNANTGTFDYRLDWQVEIGAIYRGDRAADKLRLDDTVSVNFIAFGFGGNRWAREAQAGGYGLGLHPLDLPKQWLARNSSMTPVQLTNAAFITSGVGKVEMQNATRWKDSADSLGFVGRCLDFPDEKMSYAASDRFDGVRNAWYGMDDFSRLLWTLGERGAVSLVENEQDDYYSMPGGATTRPSTENMLKWLYNMERRGSNFRRCAAESVEVAQA